MPIRRAADLVLGERAVREALLCFGCHEEELERMASDTHIEKFLVEPSMLLDVLKQIGVPAERYFSVDRLTEDGIERIKQAGIMFRNFDYAEERAEMLADIAGKSMERFYKELTIRDLAIISEYEREFGDDSAGCWRLRGQIAGVEK